MDNGTIALLSTIIGIVCGVGGFVISYLTSQRKKAKDDQEKGAKIGTIQSDLGYIKAGIDDMKRDNREMTKQLTDLSIRVTRVEESTASAHKRLDEIHNK